MYVGERLNAYSHLLGLFLAIVGTVLLLVKAQQRDVYYTVGAAVYGASLIALYLGSTVYHSVRYPRAKAWLQKVDHCAIYFLIAGSYTPFTLVTLHGAWGWSLFGVSWGLCVLGVVQELTLGKTTRRLSMILYVLMGWLVLVAIYPLIQRLPFGGLFWLVLGGVFYSVGIYWFIHDEEIRHGHGIWHGFVLAGSIAQWVCIYAFV